MPGGWISVKFLEESDIKPSAYVRHATCTVTREILSFATQELLKRKNIQYGSIMLETLIVVLLLLWLLGLVSSYTLGGFIHVLLVIAIVVVILRVVRGRRPL